MLLLGEELTSTSHDFLPFWSTLHEVLPCGWPHTRRFACKLRVSQVVVVGIVHDEARAIGDTSRDRHFFRRDETVSVLGVVVFLLVGHGVSLDHLLPLEGLLLGRFLLLGLVPTTIVRIFDNSLLPLENMVVHRHVRIDLVKEVWVKFELKFVVFFILLLGHLIVDIRLVVILVGRVDDVT